MLWVGRRAATTFAYCEGISHIAAAAGDEKELFGGVRLLRLGGHFPGSAVLHWSKGANGKGILCTGIALLPCCKSHLLGLTAMPLLACRVQYQITCTCSMLLSRGKGVLACSYKYLTQPFGHSTTA